VDILRGDAGDGLLSGGADNAFTFIGGTADFAIRVDGLITLVAGDFVL
jgi:hypothetical protein